LQRENKLELAKDIYVAQADDMMRMIKETEDDKTFQTALKSQLASVIKQVRRIRSFLYFKLGRNYKEIVE
jgi:nicotinamide riboside kinase